MIVNLGQLDWDFKQNDNEPINSINILLHSEYSQFVEIDKMMIIQSTNTQLDMEIEKTLKLIKNERNKKLKQDKNERFLIGICGIPGSGKTTISNKIKKNLQNCVVLPMDGFHIKRELLTEQGIIRRGAAFTFNLSRFQQQTTEIKKSRVGTIMKYPSFDHKYKDPVQDGITISPFVQTIIVQGLYVFHQNLKLNNQHYSQIWDFKIWIDTPLEISIERVAKRHLESGIQLNYQLAYNRANTNDRRNAQDVIDNCFNAEQFKGVNDTEALLAIIINNYQNTNDRQ